MAHVTPEASFDANNITPEASVEFDPEPEEILMPIKAYDDMLALIDTQQAEIARLNAQIDMLQSQLRAAA
jgi:hypothetical protein